MQNKNEIKTRSITHKRKINEVILCSNNCLKTRININFKRKKKNQIKQKDEITNKHCI